MDDQDWLAERFEAHRARLRAVAYRMLGSASEADDAVQEAWLRLSRSDTSEVDNLGGWLTTVVARVCLDMLRSRTSRREDPLDDGLPEPSSSRAPVPTPSTRRVLADSVGLALLVVLDTLDARPSGWPSCCTTCSPCPSTRSPRSSAAPRPRPGSSPAGRGAGCRAPLGARCRSRPASGRSSTRSSRRRASGDFAALLALLDPDVVLRADGAAVRAGAEPEVRGADAVAATFSGRARAARPALDRRRRRARCGPAAGTRVVFGFTVARGKVVAIDLVADPERLSRLHIAALAG